MPYRLNLKKIFHPCWIVPIPTLLLYWEFLPGPGQGGDWVWCLLGIFGRDGTAYLRPWSRRPRRPHRCYCWQPQRPPRHISSRGCGEKRRRVRQRVRRLGEDFLHSISWILLSGSVSLESVQATASSVLCLSSHPFHLLAALGSFLPWRVFSEHFNLERWSLL